MADPIPTRTLRDFIGSLPGGTSNSVLGDDLTMASLAAFAKKADLGDLAEKDKAEISDIDATGTPNSGTYLRGDGTWQTPAGAGDMSQAVYDPTGVNGDAFNRANHHGNMSAGDVTGLATVATTGSYNDLTDKPAAGGDVTGPSGATAGNFPALDATGKILSDSGKKPADFQPVSTDLTAIAALTSAANKLPYATGAGTWAMTDFSAFGRTLIDDADAATARTTLGVVIGTDVQAYDADTAKTDVAQQFTAAQRSNVRALSIVAGEVDWTLAGGNDVSVTATANFVWNLPSDIATYVGQSGFLIITQDGTGGRTMSVESGMEPYNADTLFDIASGAGEITLVSYKVVSASVIVLAAGGVGIAL